MYVSAEDLKKKFVEKMGEPLGHQFAALREELILLYFNWNEYLTLYGVGPDRIELLNRTAPQFFRLVQDSLWERILLHIARLIDPSQSMGRADKANLTLQNLPDLVPDADLKKEISDL